MNGVHVEPLMTAPTKLSHVLQIPVTANRRSRLNCCSNPTVASSRLKCLMFESTVQFPPIIVSSNSSSDPFESTS